MKFEYIIKDGKVDLDLLREALTEAHQEGVDYHIFWGNVVAAVNNYLDQIPIHLIDRTPITPDTIDRYATDRVGRNRYAIRLRDGQALLFRFFVEGSYACEISNDFRSLENCSDRIEITLNDMGDVYFAHNLLAGVPLKECL